MRHRRDQKNPATDCHGRRYFTLFTRSRTDEEKRESLVVLDKNSHKISVPFLGPTVYHLTLTTIVIRKTTEFSRSINIYEFQRTYFCDKSYRIYSQSISNVYCCRSFDFLIRIEETHVDRNNSNREKFVRSGTE